MQSPTRIKTMVVPMGVIEEVIDLTNWIGNLTLKVFGKAEIIGM